MCNVTIAKDKLQRLTTRTEKALYRLRYESEDYLPLTEETFLRVKLICNSNGIECPLYKYDSEVKFRKTLTSIYAILDTLANDHKIYLDYSLI